jgi:ABC-type ATPase with predicted acetyltransferase domain
MSIEYFKIKSAIRKYDVVAGKFVVNISYETAPPEPSERVVGVAEAFGLGLDRWQKFVIYDKIELKIGPQDIVYITGDSGSGKASCLGLWSMILGVKQIGHA